MPTIPLLNIQTDPLDILLAALGTRFNYLSRNQDADFINATQSKNLTLQFTSDNGVARFFWFDDGKFHHALGEKDNADLSIHFTDSLTGAKLLTKGDTASLMQAVQDGQIHLDGDYKLVLWFASLAKQATKLPDDYQQKLNTVKPYWHKAEQWLTKTLKQNTKNKS